MPYAIGKTATIRNGKFIPGGTEFEVSLAETENLKAAGFEILPESQKSGNTNNKPEIKTSGKAGNTSGKIEGTKEGSSKVPSKQATTTMGGTSSKAKVASKVTTKKEN